MTENATPIHEHYARSKAWLEANTLPDTKPEMVWVDIETTGLDPQVDRILEVGILVTDRHGFVVKGGMFTSTIPSHGKIAWEGLHPAVQAMHKNNALMETVDQEFQGHEEYLLEDMIVEFLMGHFGQDMADFKLPISGSSVDFDKNFLKHRLSLIMEQFSHRVIDVSGLKELVKLHNPGLEELHAEQYTPMKAHRAIPDLIDTIEEYRFYVAEFLWTIENVMGFAQEVKDGKLQITNADGE